MEYQEFLKSKVVVAPESGFDVDPAEVSPKLKPHQRDAVIWACKGGRRALFESFGLGKTVQELEYCRLVVEHVAKERCRISPCGRNDTSSDPVCALGHLPHEGKGGCGRREECFGGIIAQGYFAFQE